MSLETLINKSTVKFPRPLSLKETEKLFSYLTKNLPARITYHADYLMNLRNEDNRVCKDPGTASISGTISIDTSHAFDGFESKEYSEDATKISAIKFILTPGYDIEEEYTQDVRSLWNSVKEKVSDYFSQSKKD